MPIRNSLNHFGIPLIPINPAAGANIIAQDITGYTITAGSTSYTKYGKRFTMGYSGSIRLRVDMRSGADGGGVYSSTNCQIYKNGVAIGTVMSTPTNTSATITFTQDFTCNAGDYFDFYFDKPSSASSGYVSNLYAEISASPVVSLS